MVKDRRLLKVSTPEGKRIIVEIYRIKDRVRIRTKFIPEVKKDNPPFSTNGTINFFCDRKDYQETIRKLTNYFETLFLKGLADENTNTSSRISNDSRGNEKQTKSYTIGVDEGKGRDTSVYSSARGTKSTKSSRGRKPNTEVDESSDKDPSSKDQDRN